MRAGEIIPERQLALKDIVLIGRTFRRNSNFPLINMKRERSLVVDRLIKDGDLEMYQKTITNVDYEFMKNGNEMLVIK